MRAKRDIIRGALAAGVLSLASCASTADLELAREKEDRAEGIVAALEALPADTPGLADLLADAREAEATLEAQREALEALSREGIISTGIDAAGDAASGDYLGLIGTLLGTLGAGAVLALRKRLKVDLPALEGRLADAQARLESTLELQGIAASRARSAEAARSAVALAAERERQHQTEAAVAAVLARSSPGAPPAPATSPTHGVPAAPSATSSPTSAGVAPMPPGTPPTYYGDPNRWPAETWGAS